MLALTFAKRGFSSEECKGRDPSAKHFFTVRGSVHGSQDPGALGREGFGTTARARLSLGN